MILNLYDLIQLKRQEMIELGLSKGLTDEETIQCSQELDQLLNRYSREAELKQQLSFLYIHSQSYELI